MNLQELLQFIIPIAVVMLFIVWLTVSVYEYMAEMGAEHEDDKSIHGRKRPERDNRWQWRSGSCYPRRWKGYGAKAGLQANNQYQNGTYGRHNSSGISNRTMLD